MTTQIFELVDSRQAMIEPKGQSSWDLHYLVLGTKDEGEAQLLIENAAPDDFHGLDFQSYRMAHKGAGVWDVMIRYGSKKPMEFSFDFIGGSFKITEALATTYYPLDGLDPVIFNNAINVNGIKVEGVEIFGPRAAFTIKRYFDGPLAQDFLEAVDACNSKVNSDDIFFTIGSLSFSYAAGELLFLGATGAATEIGDPEITLKFAVQRNRTDLPIGDIIVPGKLGWDYVWGAYEVAAAPGRLLPRVYQANVAQVYDRTPMAALFL